ncbi:MAG: site-specific DNA-methyltransferase [Clostridiales bacterium]|nr:site-specific DNA-methyltransferase [Clostridiales bacterium]
MSKLTFTPVPVTGELHLIGGEGTVIHADFRDVWDELVSRFAGSARVVYLDPPFNTGGAFEFRRGKTQLAYRDSVPWEEHLSLIRSAAELSKKLLAPDGTLFLHIDCAVAAYCRVMLDEVFGRDAFTNEIVWAYKSGGRSKRNFSNKHDVILMYRMSPDSYFNIGAVGAARGPKRRNHMKRCVDETGRVYYSIRTGGREYRYYEDDPVYPSDVWDDVEHLNQRDPERTGFITQKPEALLKRIILSCSEEGDTVVDLFGGSGTTAAAAAKLGRSFVSVDSGAVASAVTKKRLLERCLKMRLYDANRPLVTERGKVEAGELPDLNKYFDITEKNGRVTFALKRLPAGARPFMLSAGTVEDGIFTATAYCLDPVFGDGIKTEAGKCVHLVDESFNEYYFVPEIAE